MECLAGGLLHFNETLVLSAIACALQLVDAPGDTSGCDAMEQIGILMGESGISSALVSLIPYVLK